MQVYLHWKTILLITRNFIVILKKRKKVLKLGIDSPYSTTNMSCEKFLNFTEPQFS